MIKYKIITILLLFFIGSIYTFIDSYFEYKREHELKVINYKALNANIDSLKHHNRILYYSVEDLEYSNDSITKELLKTKEELKIKDSRIKSLYYIKSKAEKRDTIYIKDTILRENTSIDTIISDKWYSNRLKIYYPNVITSSPSFISEKHVVINTKRETVKSPSPIFFIRWFQKKHTVVEVNVVEKNPYIKETENKFIEIIE